MGVSNIAPKDNIFAKSLNIGSIKTRNNVFLAPMSGVSDVPFRKAAWKAGAGMVISEMVASEAFCTGHSEMLLKAESAGLPVHMVQLAGREPEWMARAAKICEGHGADIIDINMGCPARRVTTGYSGSALMRDLDHALTLIEAVVGAVDVPVTLKMRLGWDEHSINAPDLAKRAQNAGVQLVTVHGRTRCQFYKGSADWDAVRAVKDAISIPLLINGDICSYQDGISAMKASNADGIMIGRASYGAPDLPGLVANGADLSGDARHYNVIEHYQEMISFFTPESGVKIARKHLGWFFEQLGDVPSAMKAQIMQSTDPQIVCKILEEVIAGSSQYKSKNYNSKISKAA
ncbi:MAG: tRNA dihydrouridine synthase DusB [Nitratireductor sp.]